MTFMRPEPLPIPDQFHHLLQPGTSVHWDRLAPVDQHHLVQVATGLASKNASNALVTAGLLHDLGKSLPGRNIGMLPRALHVLVARFAPSALGGTTGTSTGIGWLDDVRALDRHPALGATLAQHLGYDERVCELIRDHHDGQSTDPELVWLQLADDGR